MASRASASLAHSTSTFVEKPAMLRAVVTACVIEPTQGDREARKHARVDEAKKPSCCALKIQNAICMYMPVPWLQMWLSLSITMLLRSIRWQSQPPTTQHMP